MDFAKLGFPEKDRTRMSHLLLTKIKPDFIDTKRTCLKDHKLNFTCCSCLMLFVQFTKSKKILDLGCWKTLGGAEVASFIDLSIRNLP